MAHPAATPVQRALAELARFLENTAQGDGPDHLRARSAAVNIRSTMDRLDRATSPEDLRAGFKDAWYDTGDKGLFEWTWSAETELLLREHAEKIGQALDRADRRLR